jgi:hypothetical protein
MTEYEQMLEVEWKREQAEKSALAKSKRFESYAFRVDEGNTLGGIFSNLENQIIKSGVV